MREKTTNAEKDRAIPDDALEALARRLYPAMIAFFESEEGQSEFARWQSREGAKILPGRMEKPDKAVRLAG